MLSNAPVTTMLPVKDLNRARAFYEGKLGLKPVGLRPDGKFTYDCGGATLALIPKEGGTKADHTAVSFRVPDIAASIAELERAGVRFEDYDFPGLKTENGMATMGAYHGAWFKDSEGNILAIGDEPN